MYKYYIVYQVQDGLLGNCQTTLNFKLSDIEDILSVARSMEKDFKFEDNSIVITNFILLDQPNDTEK